MVNWYSWDCGNCWARTCLGPPNSPWAWLQQPAQLSPALACRITHSAAIRCLSLSSPNAQFSHLLPLLMSMASSELTPCSTSSTTSPVRGRREEKWKAGGGRGAPPLIFDKEPAAPEAANKASSTLCNIMQLIQEDILKKELKGHKRR